MAITWNLAGLVAQFRSLTGRSSTNDESDTECGNWINEFYVNYCPDELDVDEFDTTLTQELTATDSGEYTLSTSVDQLSEPAMVNGNQSLLFFRDSVDFFENYPSFEQYITAPTLSIGSSDTTKVLHAAFSYTIAGYAYTKASSEVDLTGDAIPVGKYGAWKLEIDADGDITVTAASENGTGYDTVRDAVEGLTSSDSDSCYMGYVTVTKSDGAFTPASTALDDAAVTDTYTDGQFGFRSIPNSVLVYGTKLYVRPKPDDIYTLTMHSIGQRPSALSGSTEITDARLGLFIALGAALMYLNGKGDDEREAELSRRYAVLKSKLRFDPMRRFIGSTAKRAY